ncbi:MAG: calcium-binding protein [Microcoleaceae cyanobacterium]
MAIINGTALADDIRPGFPLVGGPITFDGTTYNAGDIIPTLALAGNDLMLGQAGADVLGGGEGNDTLVGGADLDILLDGGAGIDFVSYEDELAGVLVQLEDAPLFGFSGPDGAAIITNVEGVIGATAGGNNLTGNSGNNTLIGGNLGDFLAGEAGDDTLAGKEGDDGLFGGEGNDLLQGNAGNDFINGEAGNDLIQGGEGNDQLTGGGGLDTLQGGLGNDIYTVNLLALAGGTRIEDVGGVTDRLILDPALTVFATAPNTTSVGVARDGENLILDINRNGIADPDTDLTIVKFYGNATESAPGVGFIEDLNGLDANTVLANTIPDINPVPGTVLGTNGNDNLAGTPSNETVRGLNGNDTLTGGGGADLLQGGLGNDIYTLNNLTTVGGTKVEDEGGNDTVNFDPALTVVAAPPSPTQVGVARIGPDLIVDVSRDGRIDPNADVTLVDFFANATSTDAGVGFIESVGGLSGNTIRLNAVEIPKIAVVTPIPNNTVPGQPVEGFTPFSEVRFGDTTVFVLSNEPDSQQVPGRNLQILGLSGNDTLTGTSGENDILGNKGADEISGGDSDDIIRGGQGSDLLNGGNDEDLLNGNQDNDILNGGSADDILRGGRGDDILSGGDNQDALIGDLGRDFLTGGADKDIFVLSGGEAAVSSLNQADIVTDFVAGADKIMLTNNLRFDQLKLVQVDLQIDGGTSVISTAIQTPENAYLGVVQGAFTLSSGDFIAEDKGITNLG